MQGAVKLGLMRGQSDVFAQLPEKLAFAAAEAVGLPPGGHENSENFALNQQWCCNERTQPSARQPLRKGERHLADVRLINQMAANAAGQAVLVDGDACLLGQGQFHSQVRAPHSDAGDGQYFLLGVVEAHATEVNRQIVFQAPDDDLEDACQILPFADGAYDPVEQIEPAELGF